METNMRESLSIVVSAVADALTTTGALPSWVDSATIDIGGYEDGEVFVETKLDLHQVTRSVIRRG